MTATATAASVTVPSAPKPAFDWADPLLLDDQLTIACGEGAVRLLRVQRAGKKPMDAAEFLRGMSP